MRISDHDRQPDHLQARQVIDVVADKRELITAQAVADAELVEGSELVVASMRAFEPELAGTLEDYRVHLGRDDRCPDTDALELADSETVATPAANRLAAILRDIHVIVREHSIEVEDDEANQAYCFCDCRVKACQWRGTAHAGDRSRFALA